MNDLVFFLGGLALLFLVWVSTGGPAQPIAQQGPYITPITGPATEQVGYGPSLSLPQLPALAPLKEEEREPSIWVRLMAEALPEWDAGTPRRAASPFSDQVEIAGGGPHAASPGDEYVTIRNVGGAPVEVTGWRLYSDVTGRETVLGAAMALPRASGGGAAGPIVLEPGDDAVILTSPSPIGASFRENACAGYLVQPSGVDAGAYDGCLAQYRERPDFYRSRWRVYQGHMGASGRPEELWRQERESIRLLDADGKTVDLFGY